MGFDARYLAKIEAMGATSRGVNAKAFAAAPIGTLGLVIVPVPPSTNHLFAGKSRRFKSKAYKAWLKVACPTLARLAPPEALPCEVWLTMRGRVNRQRDVANIEKALGDALVTVGVLPDDCLKYVVGAHQVYRPDAGEPRVEVRFGNKKQGDPER